MPVRLCAFFGSMIAAALSLAGLALAQDSAEPFKLADTQLEPVKWSEVEGWADDDHLAAFAAFQVSCQTFRSIKRPLDERPVFMALWEACRRAAAVRPANAAAADRKSV